MAKARASRFLENLRVFEIGVSALLGCFLGSIGGGVIWVWSAVIANSFVIWPLAADKLCLCSTYHFALHRIVEGNPSLFQTRSECGAKLLFQAPYQGVAKRGKMRSLYSKLRVLTTRMADDGLEYFAFIERPNDGGDHVHQLKLLPFHIVGEQPSRIGGEFEEPAVKYLGESSMGGPQRIE